MQTNITRRQFIKYSAVAGWGLGPGIQVNRLLAEKVAKTQRILILGGTGFLGPPVVERAFKHGHVVTLFNRGRSSPELFPNVEKIRGDREKGDLSGLTGSRQWDAVIDVWATEPAMVTASAKLLADRTKFYFFVSSIAAYANYSKINMDEAAPTRLDRPGYGGNKARSEKNLEEIFAGRVGIARPCAIIGPRNDGLAYHFWLSRLATDEQIVAPGTGDGAFVEYVDVRDVANWMSIARKSADPAFTMFVVCRRRSASS
jgi:2'-hydroxyisoflavone reductase